MTSGYMSASPAVTKAEMCPRRTARPAVHCDSQRSAATSTVPMLATIQTMDTGSDTVLIAGTKWAAKATKKPKVSPAAMTGRANFRRESSKYLPVPKSAIAPA